MELVYGARRAAELADFFDRENIVSKIHHIHIAEYHNHYTPYLHHHNFWTRIQRALNAIPAEHHFAALAVFANVIYITEDILREGMRLLAFEISQWAQHKSLSIPKDVHIFTVDHTRLIDELYAVGAPYGWTYRMDEVLQRTYQSVTPFLELLEQIVSTSTPSDIQLRDARALLDKKLWILLSDNVFSGTSATSDLERLLSIRDLIPSVQQPEIILCAQLITEEAFRQIEAVFPQQNVFYALYFNNYFRVNQDNCKLFSCTSTLTSVRDLCEWFGKEYFSLPDASVSRLQEDNEGADHERRTDNPIATTLNLHRRASGHHNFAYGWKDGGYTIITQNNAPTNSIPLLWYPVINISNDQSTSPSYVPPFPRNPSRSRHQTAGDTERLESIMAHQFRLAMLLETQINARN